MPTPYDNYYRAEWDLFIKNPQRATAKLAAVKGRPVKFVLDLGCGAGQELLPFVKEYNAFGVGLDISAEVGKVGRELFQTHAAQSRVNFIRGASDELPFLNETVDVVISRLALPFTNNRQTLGEISRVLKPTGLFFLKIQHPRYYLKRLLSGIKSGDLKTVDHALRVLVNGSIYFLSGYQPMNLILGRETFQTRWQLKKELKPLGLSFLGELPDSNPRTPSFVICKHPVL